MKVFVRYALCLMLIGATALSAQDNSKAGLRQLKVDAGKVTGTIRSYQGLNGPPYPVMVGLPVLLRQYKDLSVSQVRTHDFMGPTEIDSKFEQNNALLTWLIPDDAQRASAVKEGNAAIIFPDWNADPNLPASYNFKPTDQVIAAIQDSGAEVYYRIGRSFGANTNPPPDFDKFASVVMHIAMHYNQNWDDGFHYRIRYWEFWNEPELFWSGTPQQFYQLYDKTARALKAVDPRLKVGGPAKAFPFDGGPYREGFLEYCYKHKVPLDFYSWHTYSPSVADPYDAVRTATEIREVLNDYEFPKAESIMSEWNLTADFTEASKAVLQGAYNAAYVGAVLTYLQDSSVDEAHFYRGDGAWMGLFDAQGGYFKTAHAFQAMSRMLNTPKRLKVKGDDTFGFAVLAGRSADNSSVQILISNFANPDGYKPVMPAMPAALMKTAPPFPDFSKLKSLPARKDVVYRDNKGYSLHVDNLPWGLQTAFLIRRYRISASQNFDLVDEHVSSGNTLDLSNVLEPSTIELIVLQKH
jgi:xylan 1,4-beta-xylosidase